METIVLYFLTFGIPVGILAGFIYSIYKYRLADKNDKTHRRAYLAISIFLGIALFCILLIYFSIYVLLSLMIENM